MATSNPTDATSRRTRRRAKASSAAASSIAAVATLALGVGIGVAGFFWRSSSPQTSVADVVASATAPTRHCRAGAAAGDRRRRAGLTPTSGAAATRRARRRRRLETQARRRQRRPGRSRRPGPEDGGALRLPPVQRERQAAPSLPGYWHDKLVEAVKHLRRRLPQRELFGLLDEGHPGGAGARERSDEPCEELQALADDLDQTTRDVAKMHEEITAALRALVADGILEKSRIREVPGLRRAPRHQRAPRRRQGRPPRLRMTLQISAAPD